MDKINRLPWTSKNFLWQRINRGQREGEETSSQDGGIGRHVSPPCTTMRRITTNLKTKITQNCQKIKLYGSPTTKDLKEPYSYRQVGGVEMGTGAEKMQCGGGKAASAMGGPTFTCDG